MMRLLIVSLLFIFALSAAGQKSVQIRFIPTFAGKPVLFGDTFYPHPNGNDSILFESLRFYVSNISFHNGEKRVGKPLTDVRLVDVARQASLFFHVPSPASFTHIRFDLGIDSLTHASGALGGDLDPTNGMYWTWQSGYINVKLEGKSSLCTTRNNAFTFHLGGYRNHRNALRSLLLKVSDPDTVRIEIPLDRFIAQIDLATQNTVMVPGKEAVALSKIFADILITVSE